MKIVRVLVFERASEYCEFMKEVLSHSEMRITKKATGTKDNCPYWNDKSVAYAVPYRGRYGEGWKIYLLHGKSNTRFYRNACVLYVTDGMYYGAYDGNAYWRHEQIRRDREYNGETTIDKYNVSEFLGVMEFTGRMDDIWT